MGHARVEVAMGAGNEREVLASLADAVLDAVDGTAPWPDATIHTVLLDLSHSESCCLNTLQVADRTAQVSIWPDARLDATMALMTVRHAQDHPLLWHHVTTADMAVLSPDDVSTTWRTGWVFAYLRASMGVSEQLAVPIRFTRHLRSSFVVGRADRPYAAAERTVLTRAQHILRVAAGAVAQRSATRAQINALLPANLTTTEPPLSARESEVLDALASGRPRAVIARELGVAPRTLDKHVEHINAKLGTGSLVGALHRRTRASIAAQLAAALPDG